MMSQTYILYFIMFLLRTTIEGNVESCIITEDSSENVTVECNYQIPKLTNLTSKKINLFKVTNLTHNIDGNTFRGLNNIINLIINKGDRVHIASNAFKSLGALKTLSMVSLGITNLLPKTFDDLIHLELLNLHGNQLESIPDGLFDHLATLKILDLSNNRLINITGNHLQNLVNLKNLNLIGNSNITVAKNAFINIKNLEVSVDPALCVNKTAPYICLREGKQFSPRGNSNQFQKYNQMEEDQFETTTVRITAQPYNSFPKYNQTEDKGFETSTSQNYAVDKQTTPSISNKTKVSVLVVYKNESSKWRIDWIPQNGVNVKQWNVCWGMNENKVNKTCRLANNTSVTIDTSKLTSRKEYIICVTDHLRSKCENSADCYCKRMFLNGENSTSLIVALSAGLGLLFLVAIVFIILACIMHTRHSSTPSKNKNCYDVEMDGNTTVTSQNYSQQVQQQDVQTIS